MTGKELWAQYQHYSRDLTEHGRKLGFAGIATCWLFRENTFTFPAVIYFALFVFVVYFICDILHGFLAALFLRFFTQREEKKLWETTGTIEGEILKPRWVDWAAFAFFILKGVFLMLGFALIGIELLIRLFHVDIKGLGLG